MGSAQVCERVGAVRVGDVRGRKSALRSVVDVGSCTSELSSNEVDQVSHPDSPKHSNFCRVVCEVEVSARHHHKIMMIGMRGAIGKRVDFWSCRAQLVSGCHRETCVGS